jgi:opacity protein-like surface antigen
MNPGGALQVGRSSLRRENMNVRSLLAVALAALLVPLAASAQTRRTSSARPAADALSVGGWLGYEMGDADGFQLRVDGEMPFQQLTPQVKLSLVGSIGYTFAGYDVGGGFGVPGADVSVNRLKIVPAARFTLPVNPQLSLFGDAGLGLHYTSVSFEYDGFSGLDFDDSEVGLLLRFAAGAFFQVNPQLRVGGQIVLDPMFGDYDDTTFAIMAGAMFQL